MLRRARKSRPSRIFRKGFVRARSVLEAGNRGSGAVFKTKAQFFSASVKQCVNKTLWLIHLAPSRPRARNFNNIDGFHAPSYRIVLHSANKFRFFSAGLIVPNGIYRLPLPQMSAKRSIRPHGLTLRTSILTRPSTRTRGKSGVKVRVSFQL